MAELKYKNIAVSPATKKRFDKHYQVIKKQNGLHFYIDDYVNKLLDLEEKN